MASSSSSSLDRLPQDIVTDVLLRLPAETLLDLRRVYFCSVLCSDPVSGSYTLRAKLAIPFDEHALSFEVIGSVDGLVCVSMLHKRSELWTIQSMYLWNPAMRKLRDLGNRAERVAGMSRYQIHGFGRDRGGHIYRVVRITYGCTRKGEKESSMEAVQVEVCTVGRDSWRMLEPHGVSCFAGDDS
ncbi:uncharacterized protein LOC115688863 [Syzygium oleosum]|uniref:uncharacterized protein LOC115688863 n=1 Tax=Syzygium oleosum TaxID=219896 RepID=UPI0024B8D359|nr:uncharacterized protein LOC115688863 [Syzygium oleosum]